MERLNVRDGSGFNLTTLKLPQDIGIDASIPFRLNVGVHLPILQLHKDMRAFYLFRGQNVLRIPPMQDLIQNLEPDDDGLIRTVFQGVSIEVYGIPPRLTMKRRPDGVEITWKGGVLHLPQASTALGRTSPTAHRVGSFSSLPSPPSFSG